MDRLIEGSYNVWNDANGQPHLEIEVDGNWQTFLKHPGGVSYTGSIKLHDLRALNGYMPLATADALRQQITNESDEELYGEGDDAVRGWSVEVRFPPADDHGPDIYGGILAEVTSKAE